VPLRGRLVGAQILFAPALYLGREDDWLAAFEEFARLKAPSFRASALEAGRAVCLAHLGRVDEAMRVAGPLLDEVGAEDVENERPVTSLLIFLEAAGVLGQPKLWQPDLPP
jgi:hypothetical protein